MLWDMSWLSCWQLRWGWTDTRFLAARVRWLVGCVEVDLDLSGIKQFAPCWIWTAIARQRDRILPNSFDIHRQRCYCRRSWWRCVSCATVHLLQTISPKRSVSSMIKAHFKVAIHTVVQKTYARLYWCQQFAPSVVSWSQLVTAEKDSDPRA